MEQLTGKRVLIVGGSSGIGKATALMAKERGAEVSIGSRPGERLQAAAAELGVPAIEIDVGSDESVGNALESAGVWDHIVVTAGGGANAGKKARQGPVRDVPAAEAGVTFDVKFWGAYRIANLARIQEGGSLTFITGVFAYKPQAGRVMQAVSGAAVEQLVRSMALEIAPTRVNLVAPGLTDTPLWDRLGPEGRKAHMENVGHIPARRAASPEDIASMIVMCMTNPVVTGASLLADGGITLT